MDPEIVNIYDLGLIYSIKINNNNVSIEMTLTNPIVLLLVKCQKMLENQLRLSNLSI